jgi:two-component system cell cycle sensor histidine kinase/response regulator CckA
MQAVGQLAGGIVHDFNNLLTAIIGYSDLLLQRHSVADQSFGDIRQIKQNSNRAANLVRQLLAFSRRQTLQPKVLVLSDVLAELSNLLRRLLGENIELKLVLGRDVGLVKVDQGQFEQVIINLAVNARDAMPEGGMLTIKTRNSVVGSDTHTG